jgi:hypothetical protein
METYLIALLAASAVALFTYSLIKKLRKSLVAKMTRSNDQIKSLKTQIQKIAEKQKNTAEQLSIINKAVHATQPHSKMRLFTILSMPKCGGSSVKSTLLHSFPDAEIMHLHVYSLKTIQQIAEFAGRTAYPLALERLSLHVARASAARTLMNHLDSRNVFFLSGVREPVALAVSAFFQVYFVPDQPAPSYSVEQIREKIESAQDSWLNWAELDQWFDNELLVASGHDVFERPFPIEKGYDVFCKGGTRLLVYRLENMETLLDSIAELAWVLPSILHLQKTNIGKEKSYGDAYRNVVKNLKFSDAFLDRVYGSRYATHFYSATEIAAYRSRWSQSQFSPQ